MNKILKYNWKYIYKRKTKKIPFVKHEKATITNISIKANLIEFKYFFIQYIC